MDRADAIIRLVILSGVLLLVMRGRRMAWGNLTIALVIIAGLAVIIDKFLL